MLLRIWSFLDPRSGAPLWLRVLVLVALIEVTHAALSWLLMPTGRYHFGWGAVVVALGAMPTILATGRLLDELDGLRREVANLAATDLLTGVASRRRFFSALDGEGDAGVKADGMLVLLDVDHFKRINDSHGHAAGDACLRALGEILRRETGAGDLVGRLGGEEFAIFLPGIDPDRARRLGARLTLPQEVVLAGGNTVQITVSVGVAPLRGGASLIEPMRLADAALYRAKAAGRARVVFWDDPSDVAA